MAANKDEFLPNTPHTGSIGSVYSPWANGHFDALQVGGSAVASLASPTFTGTPSAPTAAPATNSAQLATTAFVDAAAVIAQARSNHTGTQLADTISDFDAAVEASPVGVASHTAGTDTGLATGTPAASTAVDIRAHLDNTDVHFEIDDAALETDLDVVLSAGKTIALINAATEGEAEPINIAAVVGAGTLAALNEVDSAYIADEAIETEHLKGGSSVEPDPSHFYGSDTVGNLGFHDLAETIPLLATIDAEAGQGTLSLIAENGFSVDLGTLGTTAAAGNDARFPIAGEKAALAGSNGTPSGSNKYLTAAWITANEVTPSDITTGTATDPGVVSAETLHSIFDGLLTPADVSDGAKLDGDIVDVDFIPSHYTRYAAAPTASDTADLAAHLYGIDTELGTITTRQDGVDTALELKADDSDLQSLITTVEGKIAISDISNGAIVDGDIIDVDFSPEHYAPTMVSEAVDTDSLSAHLAGIDEALGEGAIPDANGDRLQIDWDPDGTYVPDTSISEAISTKDLAAHLAGIKNAMLTPSRFEDQAFADGNKLHVSWAPANYEPDSVDISEADDNSDLAAHLKGIDAKFEDVLLNKARPSLMLIDVVPHDITWGQQYDFVDLNGETRTMKLHRFPFDCKIAAVSASCQYDDDLMQGGGEGVLHFEVLTSGGGSVFQSDFSFVDATNSLSESIYHRSISFPDPPSVSAGGFLEVKLYAGLGGGDSGGDSGGGNSQTPFGLQIILHIVDF